MGWPVLCALNLPKVMVHDTPSLHHGGWGVKAHKRPMLRTSVTHLVPLDFDVHVDQMARGIRLVHGSSLVRISSKIKILLLEPISSTRAPALLRRFRHLSAPLVEDGEPVSKYPMCGRSTRAGRRARRLGPRTMCAGSIMALIQQDCGVTPG